MRLRKIVLDGFKSFADKTEFTFDSSITAIVGPNGCGKSNLVDAVRWALGEQSVNSLRSGQMSDVIFSGSRRRKGLGAAEVSLFISNPTEETLAAFDSAQDSCAQNDKLKAAGQLPIEADEVQITRRIYKSGESEYRINNKICRLKDIRELLMDTGIGVKAFSIIEQGQVEQLLNASKLDRRAIFEEAAGISKYKARKKEALRKLERTEQNLLRLADILGEVTKSLRSVKLQATKARNYLQYNQRLKELQATYLLAEFDKNHTASAEKQTALEQAEQQHQAIKAEIAKNDAVMSKLGNEIIETEQEKNRAENRLVAIGSKIDQQLQRIEFLRTRITELQQRKASAGARIEKLQEQKNHFREDLAKYRAEQANCEKTFAEKSDTAEQLQEAIRQINTECASLEADLEDEKSGIIDIVRMTAQLHNEVTSISVYRNNLSSQRRRLSGRAETSQAELEKLLTEKAQHKARLGDIEKVLANLQQSLEAERKKIEQITSLVAADNKRLAASREAQSALSSELEILTDMEANREGLKTAVKNILQKQSVGSPSGVHRTTTGENNKFDYVEGILADIVAADVEYANALEAALEGKTDALLINNTNRLLADVKTIEKLDGRVVFLCLDKIEPFVDKKDLSKLPHVMGRIVEFVRTKSKYAPLVWKVLGKTIVLETTDAAIELAEKLGDEYKFVTLKGEFLSADGWISLGPVCKATGLISRKSRLRQLQQTISSVGDEITSLKQQIEKNNQANAHLEKLCKDLRTAIYEANTEKVQVSSKLTVCEQNIKRLTGEQPLIASEIGLLEEQIAQSVQKEYDSKQKLQELEAVNSQRSQRIEQLQRKYAEQKALQQTQSSRLTDLKVALGQIAEHQQALKQTIASVANQRQQARIATDAAQKEIQISKIEIQNSNRDILNCEAAVSELFVEKEKKQQSTAKLHNKIEQLLEEQKQTEQLIRQKRTEESEIDQRVSGLKIELSQLEIKQQGLIERAQEELLINLVQSYENYDHRQVDWDKIREEKEALRGKIERLGNVNVDAIDEQGKLEERHNFLSSQVEDLNKSKASLQQLISRLNRKSREKFRQSFEEIRVHFQQIFRKLFGGGKADIVLEDTASGDILEAGIEIIAQPPGKETMSIFQLSGGEKALTAITLLFAVFKSKPSLFCFLDEVDATLDEANNERFNLLIREFEKNSQFIIITHSKRTMSIADMLFGITMQTPGVSKKISIHFGDVEQDEQQVVAVA